MFIFLAMVITAIALIGAVNMDAPRLLITFLTVCCGSFMSLWLIDMKREE